jgi:spermidine/putrescine transport system permease protein
MNHPDSRSLATLLRPVALVLYAFLYAPILVVVGLAFNAQRHGLGWGGFTLGWFAELGRNEVALAALRNSLVLAAVSTAISTGLGSLLGVGLSRPGFPGRRAVDALLQLPVLVPDIVMAVALLLFANGVRRLTGLMELGMTTMVLAHCTFQIPFVAMVVRARCAGMDPAWAEAAADLGASPARAFLHVTLPLLRPGIIAGALLAFALSLDDFVISFFTSGPGSTTLPILIHASVRRGITPDIHALSSLLVGAAVVTTLAASRFQRQNLGRS